MSYSFSSIRQAAFQLLFLFGCLHHMSYHISTTRKLTFLPVFLFGWLHHMSYHISTTRKLTFLSLFLFRWLHHMSYHISTTWKLMFLQIITLADCIMCPPIFPLLETDISATSVSLCASHCMILISDKYYWIDTLSRPAASSSTSLACTSLYCSHYGGGVCIHTRARTRYAAPCDHDHMTCTWPNISKVENFDHSDVSANREIENVKEAKGVRKHQAWVS